jgi:hypothetical protein
MEIVDCSGQNSGSSRKSDVDHNAADTNDVWKSLGFSSFLMAFPPTHMIAVITRAKSY